MAQAAKRRVTAKDPGTKLVHRRLTVLELAERLGNVSEACRRGGMDRTSFYEWKRRFQTQGFAGLRDLPPETDPVCPSSEFSGLRMSLGNGGSGSLLGSV